MAGCLIAALAAAPAAALADSDPASDYLPTADVYLPYQPPMSKAVKADLLGVTQAAKRAGYPIKVAVIGSAVDLGGVPDLFNQPERYAPFLSREITFNGKAQPLLVVMPVGFGTFQVGPRGPAAIAKLKVGSGVDGLGRAAVEAVQKLAAAAGHPIHGFKPSSTSGSGGGGSSALIFGVPLALLVVGLAIASYRRVGRDEEEEEEQAPVS